MALTGVAVPTLVDAQNESQRVTAAVRSPGAGFGEAVAMVGRTMVVGAPGSGTVHVFEHVRGSGFVERQVLVAPSGSSASRFGAFVVLDGERLGIGAPGEDAVYVWSRLGDGSFSEATRVQAAVPQVGSNFGVSLALRGDRLVVGAPWQDARTGAVHLFGRQSDGTYAPVSVLRPADVTPGDELGFAVVLDDDGTTLFASAMQDDDGALDGGAVHVLAEQAGTFVAVDKLIAPDAAATDRAGRALACSGDLLAVGVRNDDDRGRESGSVTLWDRSGGSWAHAGKLIAPDGAVGDLFGHGVALLGERLLVGAMAKDQGGFVLDVGRAYLFERGDTGAFAFVDSFRSPVEQHQGRFGSAVALGVRGFAIGGAGVDSGAGEVLTSMAPPRVDAALSTLAVDPVEIEVGEEATITAVVLDDLGEPMGSGLTVTFSATLGQLVGDVMDVGDGRYSQRILGDVAGTAEIAATADGVALDATATLSIREPEPMARVVAQARDGSLVPFDAIQPALDRAGADDFVRIVIAPGTYEEVLRIDRRHDLAVHGLNSHGVVTVRGLRISRSSDVLVEGLHVQPGSRGFGGVRVALSERVILRSLFVDGTRCGHAGIVVGPFGRDVTLEACHVERASGDGIRTIAVVFGFTVRDCTVTRSAKNGIELGAATLEVLVAHSTLIDNGQRARGGDGYGIVRRGGHRARPEDVTLLANDLRGNDGRVQRHRSTRDLGRYDLMLDGTDEQLVGGR